MIRLIAAGRIDNLPGFDEGFFVVQDLAAAEPVRLLNPQPTWRILDLCAAPGTKTSQLAEISDGKAEIFATDINPDRLKRITENVARLHLAGCVTVIDYDYIDQVAAEPFDCILLDVPCSNTAVMARRVEVRYRLRQDAITHLASGQLDLLKRASPLLKPAGRICYSTCSIQPEENEMLIRRFLNTDHRFSLAAEKLTLPSATSPDHDGGYAAILTA